MANGARGPTFQIQRDSFTIVQSGGVFSINAKNNANLTQQQDIYSK